MSLDIIQFEIFNHADVICRIQSHINGSENVLSVGPYYKFNVANANCVCRSHFPVIENRYYILCASSKLILFSFDNVRALTSHINCMMPFVLETLKKHKIAEVKEVYDKLRLLLFDGLMKDHIRHIILTMLIHILY